MTKKEKITTKDWTYVGEVKNGKPHGKGKRTWSVKVPFKQGTKYEGSFKNGKENGKGKLRFPPEEGKGDLYVGGFKEGKFHGKGIYTNEDMGKHYQSGLKDIGVWKNGKPIKGKTIYKDGTKYIGDWTWTVPAHFGIPIAHGYGKITYPNGNKFVGKFYNDEPVKGEGTIHWNDAKYVGEVRTKDGSLDQHGEGIMTFKNGDKLIGYWKDGKPIKAEKYVFFGEDIKWEYEGTLGFGGGDMVNGKGILKTIDTKNKGYYTFEKGNFVKCILEGRGTRAFYYDKNFTRPFQIYKGEFKNGEYHGKGEEVIYDLAEGWIKLKGTFKKGQIVVNKNTKKIKLRKDQI